MNRKVFNYLQIAAQAATRKKDERSFLLGACAIRSDGAIVVAANASSEFPERLLHAENRLTKKLDKGAIVYVARVKLIDGSFGMAKPCIDCQKVLMSKKVKRVYYTINPENYGIWIPKY